MKKTPYPVATATIGLSKNIQSSIHVKSEEASSSPTAGLLSLAAVAGRDTDAITAILNFIDVHPLLIDLPRILQGLVNVLDAMAIDPVLSIENCDPRVWSDECHWVISNRKNPVFTSKLGPLFYSGDERRNRNPVIGMGVQEHPFPYATLWHEPVDVENELDYNRLIGQLLAIHQLKASSLDLLGQKYAAYLELRSICAQRKLTVPADLDVWSSSAMFVHGCRQFDAGSSIDRLALFFPPITRLARYFDGDIPPERSGSGNNHQRGLVKDAGPGVMVNQEEVEVPLEDPDDPDLLPGYLCFVPTQQTGVDIDEALPPGEITPPSGMCLINTGDEVRPFVAELLSFQGMIAHITSSRQYIPYKYEQLTLLELATLLFLVTDVFLIYLKKFHTAPSAESNAIRLRLEALLALHIMLWFGRTLEDCKKLRLAKRGSRPKKLLELVPADDAGQAEFRFFVPTPEYFAEEHLPQAAVRLAQNTISVPDMVGASSLVMLLIGPDAVAGGAVFNCKINALEHEVRVVLSELGGGDTRYTIHKVRSYLHRQIIGDSHDVVAATMLTGVPCLSANTPLYYVQYDVNYLRSLYCSSVRHVVSMVYACAGLEAPTTKVVAVEDGAVGARNCLRIDTVKANLEALLIVLRKRPRNDLKQLIHWHNCQTLWTVLMFLMATGCRAIRNPLKKLDEFESRWGYGALGDKGSDDGHMSRLVALPDMVRRQLQAYEAHCQSVGAHLNSLLPISAIQTYGFFLRLDESKNLLCDEVRPRNISAVMQQVEGYTPHPVNGFRKLVRTELAERGCPPETLAAYMGHWLQGEEPQDTFSSICPRTYVQNLHAFLLPLMREVGWIVRNSHLVTGDGV